LRTSSRAEAGTRPTRYSWTFTSFGTPTRMAVSTDLSRRRWGRGARGATPPARS
jgi:hypothetical protein